ncbi:MAG: hypothetical protein ACKOXW_01980 [Actinomycetes bacterium]
MAALHAEFLKEVAGAGSIIFATTDAVAAHEDRPLWLSIDIAGDALLHTTNLETDLPSLTRGQ